MESSQQQPLMRPIMKPSLMQPRLIQERPNMFFALGHGTTTTEQLFNNTNVTLINRIRCGNVSSARNAFKDVTTFSDLVTRETNLDFFTTQDEPSSTNNSRLAVFFMGTRKILPGKGFVDGIYTPLTDLHLNKRDANKGEIQLYSSGLRDVKNTFTPNNNCVLHKNSSNEFFITTDNIKMIFKDSLYPTVDAVLKYFTKVKDAIEKKQQEQGQQPMEQPQSLLFYPFKFHFMKKFDVKISTLLKICDALSQKNVSVLYYPLCREIPGIPLDVSIERGLKLSDESHEMTYSNDRLMGTGTRKRRKNKSHKKRKSYKKNNRY